jgi:hypothetical protein
VAINAYDKGFTVLVEPDNPITTEFNWPFTIWPDRCPAYDPENCTSQNLPMVSLQARIHRLDVHREIVRAPWLPVGWSLLFQILEKAPDLRGVLDGNAHRLERVVTCALRIVRHVTSSLRQTYRAKNSRRTAWSPIIYIGKLSALPKYCIRE